MNLRCPKCNFDAKNMTSLGTHVAMKHGISGENLYCILNNISQKPTCKCGCGSFVTYVSLTKGYKTFVKGHTSQDVAKLRGKTERQVANDAGVYRVYGCKNARFVLCLEAKDENQEN